MVDGRKGNSRRENEKLKNELGTRCGVWGEKTGIRCVCVCEKNGTIFLFFQERMRWLCCVGDILETKKKQGTERKKTWGKRYGGPVKNAKPRIIIIGRSFKSRW